MSREGALVIYLQSKMKRFTNQSLFDAYEKEVRRFTLRYIKIQQDMDKDQQMYLPAAAVHSHSSPPQEDGHQAWDSRHQALAMMDPTALATTTIHICP